MPADFRIQFALDQSQQTSAGRPRSKRPMGTSVPAAGTRASACWPTTEVGSARRAGDDHDCAA